MLADTATVWNSPPELPLVVNAVSAVVAPSGATAVSAVAVEDDFDHAALSSCSEYSSRFSRGS